MYSAGATETIRARNVAVCTGHHAKPNHVKFNGQDAFGGEIMHSVKFKDARWHGLDDKTVLVVGIGNSAVDVAVNLTTVAKKVFISTRSGAWVIPPYVFGAPVDHYACRLFLKLPWKVANLIFETIISALLGSPRKWDLNPRMKILQTQPTVSHSLIHHISRGDVIMKPNVKEFSKAAATFDDGSTQPIDAVVMCTGYSIDLPFLVDVADVLKENDVHLYKNVFRASALRPLPATYPPRP